MQGWLWLDTVFTIIVAGVIAFLAYQLFKQALPILVDSTRLTEDHLRRSIMALAHVTEIRHLRTRYDGLKRIGDITVTTPKELTLEETHQLTDSIEQLMADEFGVADTVVHVEPDTYQPSDIKHSSG